MKNNNNSGMMPPVSFYTHYGKRGLDVFFSFLIILILLPLIVLIILLILIFSPGPIYYQSTRVGLFGKFFKMNKFRTMIIHAEEMKRELASENQRKGPLFKIKDDPRVTLIGFFLRKFSLDELPQLWNVFTGDMSLIGPRPAIPHEVQEYDDLAMQRLNVKPGMTGYWQIKGRAALPFDEGIELDLYYIQNLSFWLDMKILLSTIPAVLGGKGAY